MGGAPHHHCGPPLESLQHFPVFFSFSTVTQYTRHGLTKCILAWTLGMYVPVPLVGNEHWHLFHVWFERQREIRAVKAVKLSLLCSSVNLCQAGQISGQLFLPSPAGLEIHFHILPAEVTTKYLWTIVALKHCYNAFCQNKMANFIGCVSNVHCHLFFFQSLVFLWC